MFEICSAGSTLVLLCRGTSVTNLPQDIGDTLDRLGGDTSTTRLRRWLPMNPSIPVSASRSRSGLKTPTRGGLDLLRRARHLPQVLLRTAQACPGRGASGGARAQVQASAVEPVEADRGGQGPGGASAGRARGVRAGPRPDQRAREDARDGPGPGPLDGVVGADVR